MSTARRVCDERGEHVILRCEPVVSATSMSFSAASMFRARRARQEHVTCSTSILRCDSEIALRTSLHHALPQLSHDNGNVHRAAAKIIVSKSRAARGSVCNVLLSPVLYTASILAGELPLGDLRVSVSHASSAMRFLRWDHHRMPESSTQLFLTDLGILHLESKCS